MTLCEESQAALPDDVIAAFTALGEAQRGDPEVAMIQVQQTIGGGVLSLLVEHVGDITHRMTHMIRYNLILGREKVFKTLRWLNDSYGFEKENAENIASNAKHRGIQLARFQKQVKHVLRVYAEAHAALPVYNQAQWLARQAEIDVGLEHFNGARSCLKRLTVMAPTDEAFAEHAREFSRNPDGSLTRYEAPSS